MARKILAFYSPYPGAGKSTAAEHLQHKYSYMISSFADPLRILAQQVLNAVELWDCPAFEDKEAPIKELGGASGRDLLIAFGAAGRSVYPDIWVKCLRSTISKRTKFYDVVVDDLRFPNEYRMLREEGAKIVRIIEPGREIIPSETEALLEEYKFDAYLANDKQGFKDYHTQLEALIQDLWPA